MSGTGVQGSPPHYKRRHYFINKKLQGKFIAYFLLLGLLIVIGTSVLIWFLSSQEFERFIYRTHLSAGTPWEVVFPVMLKAIVVSAAVLVISVYLFTHIIFKRMTARLQSFNDTLISIGKGDLNVRVEEYGIDEISDPLRHFVEKMRQDIQSLKDIQHSMKNLIDNAEKADTRFGFSKEMQSRSAALMKKLEECKLKTDG